MSSRNILVINCGSSSVKFTLVNRARSLFPLHGLAERPGSRDAVLRWRRGDDSDSLMIPNTGHRAVLIQLLPVVQNIAGDKLHGIDHRVMHGGELSTHAIRIDDRVTEAIRATAPLAPLHNPANLQGIEATMTLFPKLSHITAFNTAFHQSLPEHAYHYTLPEVLHREHSVRRYSFHGTGHRYVSHCTVKMVELTVGGSSWLSAHFGNDNSTCAIVNGQSLDTSMDLTSLENLVTGTRSGDVDLNLHGHLAWILGWSLECIGSTLNNGSGPLSLSDLSNDVHTLGQEREQGHPDAALTIEVFYYRLAKSLAAMSCALSQLDRVIFIGGINEDSPLVRAKTVAYLQLFGLCLDQEANARYIHGIAGPIQAAGHPRILVILTNEERQIALDTLALPG